MYFDICMEHKPLLTLTLHSEMLLSMNFLSSQWLEEVEAEDEDVAEEGDEDGAARGDDHQAARLLAVTPPLFVQEYFFSEEMFCEFSCFLF